MSVSDPIADMLTRIRNAVMAGHTVTAMPSSKIKADIAKILKKKVLLRVTKLWMVSSQNERFCVFA